MSEGHYCTVHGAKFTRKTKDGKEWYSHPYEDENGDKKWCNEKDLEKVQNLEPQPSDKLLPKDQKIIDEVVGVKPTPKSVSEDIRENMEWKGKQITENMFWGHLKDWLVLKEGDKGADPFWKQLRTVYLAKMLSVLDIKIEDK